MQQMTVSLSPHVRDEVSTRHIMRDVVIALIPSAAIAVWRFGWYAAVLILLSCAFCVGVEAGMQKLLKRAITVSDGSAVVTGMLIAFNLPPEAPWWMTAVGAVVAIGLVKQLFGGLGRNFVNPALIARAVLLASWPVHMTSFAVPGAVDAVTSATPLARSALDVVMRPGYIDLLLGNCGGSIGEVGRLGLLIGAAYLLIKRVIDWRIPASFIGISLALVLCSRWLVPGDMRFIFLDPLYYLLSGGLILGAFFMATDYVTCPVTPLGRVIFGAGCALITFAIRAYGAYPEGVSYSILVMNVAAPLIERYTFPKVYGRVKKHA